MTRVTIANVLTIATLAIAAGKNKSTYVHVRVTSQHSPVHL